MALLGVPRTMRFQVVATVGFALAEALVGAMSLSAPGAPGGLYFHSLAVAAGTLAVALTWWAFLREYRMGMPGQPVQRWEQPAAIGALLALGAVAVVAVAVHSAPAWMPPWLSELPRAGLVTALVVLVVPCRQVWRLRSR